MKTTLTLLASLCLFSALPAQENLPTQETPIIDANSFQAPHIDFSPAADLDKYLGWGYDSTTGEDKPKCLQGIKAVLNSGGTQSSMIYQETSSAVSMRTFLEKSLLSPSKQFGRWGSVSSHIHRILKVAGLSKNDVAVTCVIQYRHGQLVINNPFELEVTDSIKNQYISSYKKFTQAYGDGYVSSANLGECLVVILKATRPESSKFSKKDLSKALQIKFSNIANLPVDSSKLQEAESLLSDCNVCTKVCATLSGWMPSNVTDQQSFKRLINEFQNQVSHSIKMGKLSALNEQLEPYCLAIEKQSDPVVIKNIEHLNQWLPLQDKLSDLASHHQNNADITQECQTALSQISKEMNKCQTKHTEARAPYSDEFASLLKKWAEIETI